MSAVNARYFIEELRFDIRSKDKIKARIVLSHFGENEDQDERVLRGAISALGAIGDPSATLPSPSFYTRAAWN